MSAHEVRVVRLGEILPHPKADALGVTRVEGYDVVVRRADWHAGDLAVFIEPDYVVPEGVPWAAVLGEKRRVRAKKIRGVISQGLLVNPDEALLPADTEEGDDVMAFLGITRWNPPEEVGDNVQTPAWARHMVPYDLESWRRYRHLFTPDARVVVTEKFHGETGRFTYGPDGMHAGSRTHWKRLGASTPWGIALRANPWIESWCRTHPEAVLVGEVFGNVRGMEYGIAKGSRGFLAFDVWYDGLWYPWETFESHLRPNLRVPVLYEGPHAGVTEFFAEGPTTLLRTNPHVREGFVVQTVDGRSLPGLPGDRRAKLKCIGAGYNAREELPPGE